MQTDKQRMCVAPRRRFPCSAYVILTAVQERSLDYARDDDGAKRYQNSVARLDDEMCRSHPFSFHLL